MSALSVVQDAERSLEKLPLGELGEIVTREHAAASHHARAALENAIRCGEALLEARGRVASGEWGGWLERRGLKPTMASRYMRVAYYRDQIPAECDHFQAAVRILVHYPELRGLCPEHPAAPEIRRLRAEGLSCRRVAAELGVSSATVYLVMHPDAKRKYAETNRARARRSRAARRALAEKERADAITAKGGEIAKAYNLLRQAEQLLGRAKPEVDSREAKTAVDDALRALATSIDKTWEAVKLG